MALDFDSASNEKVDVGSGASLDNLANRTALAWVFPTSAPSGSNPIIYSKAMNNWSAYQYFDMRESAGAFRISQGAATSGGEAFCRCTDTIALDTWSFVAGVLSDSGTATDHKVYIGGLATLASEAASYVERIAWSGSANDDSSQAGSIGNYHFYPGSWARFPGRIAVVGVWNRILSLSEIRAQQFRPHATSGCVGLWFLGFNGTGTQADFSGNGNNGTVTGASVAAHVPLANPFSHSSYFSPASLAPILVVPSALTLQLADVDPTVVAGSVAITPGAENLNLSLFDPAVVAGSISISPGALS
ncbi:MAG: LamG domain-containing protein, partial [bacterium]|nr:LamG domain-containing protein [bacterium]